MNYWRQELWNLGRTLAVLGGVLTGLAGTLTVSDSSVPGMAFVPMMAGAGAAYLLGAVSLDVQGWQGWVAAPFELIARMFEVMLMVGLGAIGAVLLTLVFIL